MIGELPIAAIANGPSSELDGFLDQCIVPLTEDHYEENFVLTKRASVLSLADLKLDDNYNSHIPLLRVPSASIEGKEIQLKLRNEFRYICFLGIHAFVLQSSFYNEDFINCLLELLQEFPSLSFSIKWDISKGNARQLANWDEWSNIQRLFKMDSRISLFLQISDVDKVTNEELDLWLYEPIRYLHIQSPFINGKIENFVQKLHQLKCLQHPYLVYSSLEEFKLIHGFKASVKNCPPLIDEISLSLRHKLSNLHLPPKALYDSKFILQSPLEPTIENLSYNTYETFESDQYKYKKYARAILCAMMQLKNDKQLRDVKLEVLCVGPGRGPLIDKFFDAVKFIQLDHIRFNITAVERNPAVMPYLEYKNNKCWGGKVTLYCADIRHWQPKDSKMWPSSLVSENAMEFKGYHLVFSELIGSFGCNELMPEVLDPVIKFQNKSKCIWIPQSVECYISPVHCPWLNSLSNDEGIYVPIVSEYRSLISAPQKVWSFNYSNPKEEAEYSKHYRQEITIDKVGCFHGLAGYFKSVLFPGIEVDNLPRLPSSSAWVSEQSQSNSWLPMYFSIKRLGSIRVSPGDKLVIDIQRKTSKNSMLYEWNISNSNFQKAGGPFEFNLY